MKKILFGTNNPNKLREIREMLSDGFEVQSLQDVGIDQDVEETEPTLEGNAALKAKAFYQLAQIPCFSDDTGLEVDALNGAPGVITARYAGPACRPKDNIEKMLREMEGKTERSAQFRTVIAYYDGVEMKLFEGVAKGNITESTKGEKGFGYDPIFQPEGYAETFAQLSPDAKNAISHRGKAIREFVEFLKDL